MDTVNQPLPHVAHKRRFNIHFNPEEWIRLNITRSWWLTAWLALLAYITVRFTLGQLAAAPTTTTIVLILWLSTVAAVAFTSVTHYYNVITHWLKENLYNSITNTLLTLILALALLAAVRGIISYAFVNASYVSDPDIAATLEYSGANWGAIIANMRNFMVFRFPRDADWRIYVSLAIVAVLAVASFFVYRPSFKDRFYRNSLSFLWFLSPIAIFILLRGITEEGPLRQINPDIAWGGLLLTIIISVFAIVVSFPLGLLLALGRRSQIPGIPAWLTYGAAAILTILGLATSTRDILASAGGPFQTALAYWPLLLPLIAYLFQRYFRGNVVAAFSTLYIEMVRGVPLITVLVVAIILFPIFLPPGVEILNTWRVLAGFALFSAAYLAENVRGGLQAIPKGQYEAADALGLNTYQKYRMIILPQALRAVIPAIVGQFIGLFKDTSLIAIIGLFDVLGIANSIASQTQWLGVRREAYIFAAIVYYIGSALMNIYSRRLEIRLGVGER